MPGPDSRPAACGQFTAFVACARLQNRRHFEFDSYQGTPILARKVLRSLATEKSGRWRRRSRCGFVRLESFRHTTRLDTRCGLSALDVRAEAANRWRFQSASYRAGEGIIVLRTRQIRAASEHRALEEAA